jgi:hypothetical protein
MDEDKFQCSMCNTMHYYDDYHDTFRDTEHTRVERIGDAELLILDCHNCGAIAAIQITDDSGQYVLVGMRD